MDKGNHHPHQEMEMGTQVGLGQQEMRPLLSTNSGGLVAATVHSYGS